MFLHIWVGLAWVGGGGVGSGLARDWGDRRLGAAECTNTTDERGARGDQLPHFVFALWYHFCKGEGRGERGEDKGSA